MSAWRKVPLGELCKVISGGTPSRSELGYYGGGIPWVKIGDMLQGTILDTEETITEAGLKNSSAKLLPAGTVIISIFATIGRTATLGVDATTNQAIAGLVPYDSSILIPDYLRRFLDHAVQTLQNEARGVAQVNINSKILKKIEIPLPPVGTQEEIVAVLDQADRLRAQRKRAISLLDDLGQSLFVHMFGDLVSNDYSWPLSPISAIVKGFETGKSLAEGQDDTVSQYRILKISAVTSGRFKAQQSKPAPEGYEPPKLHFVHEGDLLFSRANTSELIGATAFVPSGAENLLMPDKLWRFVWNHDGNNKPSPWFVHYLFRQSSVRDIVRRNASGSSGSMKNISQSKVLSMRIGIPPAQLQKAFERKILEMEALRQTAESGTVTFDGLFRSLQARAFRGEL